MDTNGEECYHKHENDNEWEQIKNDRDDHFYQESE
jgi:hypothetical protein